MSTATAVPQVAVIKITQILRPPENVKTLRPVVKDTDDYQGLLADIRKRGIRQPIEVRELGTLNEAQEPVFGLVNGNNRLTIAEELGMQEIPVIITNVDDANLLEAQMLSNLHTIATKPMEFTEAILTILFRNPTLTKKELEVRLSVGEGFIDKRLSLLNLQPEIQKLVNEEKLLLTNAFALTKLPKELQNAHLDQAKSMTGEKFTQYIYGVLQELKAAKAQGRAPKVDHFIPTPYLQKLPVLKEQLENPKDIFAQVEAKKLTSPSEIIKLTLQWALHLDEVSVANDTKVWEEAKAKRAAEAKARKEEAEKKKLEESKKLAEKATLVDLK